jgi:hypothetical protein
MKTSLALLAVASTAELSTYEERFTEWKAQFPGAPASLEAFAANIEKMEKFNTQPDNSITLGVNQFTGMTHEQFQKNMLSTPEEAKRQYDNIRSRPLADLKLDGPFAEDIDWYAVVDLPNTTNLLFCLLKDCQGCRWSHSGPRHVWRVLGIQCRWSVMCCLFPITLV